MLGQIMEWFYHDLAGIQNGPGSPGFKQVLIRPQARRRHHVDPGAVHSIRGKIVSDWKREGDKFALKVSIPANTTATVFVPAKTSAGVTESGKPASSKPGREIFSAMKMAARSLKSFR